MILDTLSLQHCLTSIESVLKLEYTKDAQLDEIMKNAIKRLEDTYGVTIDKDIYTLQGENQLSGDSLSQLVQDITECLKQFALYSCLNIFNHSLTFSLSEVNYLGYSRSQLLQSLKYLQDKHLYNKRTEVIASISGSINNVSLSIVKRLFVSMLLLEKLGISEGVAILAQLLYMGGIVV